MHVNEPICLYQGDMILWAGDESDRGMGRIMFRWLPSPETRFEMVGTKHSINHVRAYLEHHEVEIELPGGYSQKASATLSSNTSIDLAGKESPKYHGVLTRYYDKVKTPKCDTVEFFLINFRLAQSLKNEEWTIDIELLTQNLKSTFDALECERGYAVTHKGILRRVNGLPFTLDQANDILYALYQFYSFIQGEWSGPILCKGMLDNEITWERWGNPNLAPFKSQTGIARSVQFDQSKAFDGFMRMWADIEWKETFILVVYLYVEANTMSMVEGAIILLQSALEGSVPVLM